MTFPILRALPHLDDEGNETGAIIITSERDNESIAYVYASEAQATFVRLALAASDMLAALETMESLYADHAQYDDEGYEIAAIKATQAAIAKAKNAF